MGKNTITYFQLTGLIFIFSLVQAVSTLTAQIKIQEKTDLKMEYLDSLGNRVDQVIDTLTENRESRKVSRAINEKKSAKNIAKITEDSLARTLVLGKDSVYKPNPTKAIWYSALFPGLGQVYNKRYWKLPIIGAGITAISYAIGWNNKYYVAYTNAYRDFTDENPDTQSYIKLLPNGSTYYSSSNFTTILKNRQQIYRRYRDLSIIGAVGIYLFCILDAYVDAQLYDFDISSDLSLQPSIGKSGFGVAGGVEMSLSFRF